MALGRRLHMYRVWTLCSIYSIYKRQGVRQRDNTTDLNDLNMYVRDVVAIFKLFARTHPPAKYFFILPLYYYIGATQLYISLYICFSSLLTRFKQNINSSC